MNKKNLLIAFCAAILVLSAGTAKADLLVADSGWVSGYGCCNGGPYYGSYTVSSSGAVNITITDNYLATDNYDVYLNGTLVTSTNLASDFDYIANLDAALADSSFVHVFFGANNGDLIEIWDRVPVNSDGNPVVVDGTWGIRADSAVPEPGTMILLGSGLAGFIARRRMLNS